MSSSGGKVPLHGPRRILVPAKHASDPFVVCTKRRFTVSDQENKFYLAICRIANSTKWQSHDAVDIDTVRAKFYSFGHSFEKFGMLSPYVMSVFCRVLFHDNHPSKSKRNYFFPSIGAQLTIDINDVDLEKVEKSFKGAASARKLHLCDMLYFPILYQQHWFVFLVDLKDRMLVFLDSIHEEGDDFFEPILPHIDLQSIFQVFKSSSHMFQSKFLGIFSMKYMELWSPRVILQNEFSKDNINNIRVQYANRIFFHPNNKMLGTEVEEVVLNWFDHYNYMFNLHVCFSI
uniref:Ubiquitin-like protease family profile domain-containing protein n=1 Tax=Oryza punctata TaxID=4537 RepID=A0A0E0LA14_ORYPU